MQNTELINIDELIISLLKADITNSKLISRLENIGIMIDDYCLDMCTPVLQLMGFTGSEMDELNTIYLNALDRIIKDNHDDFHTRKNSLALELYTELLAEKKCREKLNKV